MTEKLGSVKGNGTIGKTSSSFNITVRGKTFREISEFVAKELALIDAVNSTATQFIMRKYKENGIELKDHSDDGRSKISL